MSEVPLCSTFKRVIKQKKRKRRSSLEKETRGT
jgi:hypothetical protein